VAALFSQAPIIICITFGAFSKLAYGAPLSSSDRCSLLERLEDLPEDFIVDPQITALYRVFEETRNITVKHVISFYALTVVIQIHSVHISK
jgi:hypothetical protein